MPTRPIDRSSDQPTDRPVGADADVRAQPRVRSIDRSVAWAAGADADICAQPRAQSIDRSIRRSHRRYQARHRQSPSPQPRIGRSHRRTGEENADADLRAAGRAEDAPTTEGAYERTAGESAVIDGCPSDPQLVPEASPEPPPPPEDVDAGADDVATLAVAIADADADALAVAVAIAVARAVAATADGEEVHCLT